MYVYSTKPAAPAERRVIAGCARAIVLEGPGAAEDADLWDFPCGFGAISPEALRAVREVRAIFTMVYVGRPLPFKVVKVSEDGGGLIGAGVICMNGDQKRTTEPYIEAIARHDDYRRCVLSDGKTTAGAIVLRAMVETVALEYEGHPTPEIWARVLENNTASHQIFTDLDFDRLRKGAFNPPTEQVMRIRRSDARPLEPLDEGIYMPPVAPSPPPPTLGRHQPCRCGSGKKFKKCHGF